MVDRIVTRYNVVHSFLYKGFHLCSFHVSFVCDAPSQAFFNQFVVSHLYHFVVARGHDRVPVTLHRLTLRSAHEEVRVGVHVAVLFICV